MTHAPRKLARVARIGVAILLVALGAGELSAGTYYISWSTGSDANNGTSTATPWRRCPGMNGFSGSYSHVAGDRFIFKGGDTWPNAAFQMRVTQGGSSVSVQDQYTVDTSWFTGASWARPIFDAENTRINNGLIFAAMVHLNAGSYITINGIEFKRLAAATSDYGSTMISFYGGSPVVDYVTITNCVFRDWQMVKSNGTPYTSADSGEWDNNGQGGVGYFGGYGGNNLIVDCVFNQAGVTQKSGVAVRNSPNTVRCEIYSTVQGVLGGYMVDGCEIHDFPSPTQAGNHCNGVQTFGPSLVRNNILYNLANEAAPILLNPDWGSLAGQQNLESYAYNNVLWNTGIQTPIGYSVQNSASGVEFYFWNNTVYAPSTWPVRGEFGAITADYLEMKGNHFITDLDPPYRALTTQTIVYQNNVRQTPTVANGQGYTTANQFQPTDGADATVGAGQDLSAHFTTDISGNTRSVPWDAGAYEWSGIPTPGNLAMASATYSTAENTTVVVTISRTGGTSGSVGISYATANDTAIAGTDYTSTSGSVSLANGVGSTTVNIPILRNVAHTGNRSFTFTLSSPTGGASLVAPTSATITITDTDPPPTPIPTFTQAGGDISIAARLMLAVAPFTIEGNVATQSIETTSTNNAGQLQAYCVVTNIGDATFEWEIYGSWPHDGANSGFFRLNSTNDICDVIPVTSGFETRKINWRGTGSFDAPEFQPIRLKLTGPSTNLIVWYGREPHSISNIVWKLQSDPPPPPQQVNFASSTAFAYDNSASVSLTVVRNESTGTVTVDYATADGTALAGIDYTSTSGTVTLSAGEVTDTIVIPILARPEYQGNRLFSVSLSNPTGADLASPTNATIALLDSESPVVPVLVRIGGRVIFGGEVRIGQ